MPWTVWYFKQLKCFDDIIENITKDNLSQYLFIWLHLSINIYYYTFIKFLNF